MTLTSGGGRCIKAAMKLRILMLLLAVLAPGLARSQFTYFYDSYAVGKKTNYIATVTGYTGGGDVVIPTTVIGRGFPLNVHTVVAIGTNAFANNTAIASVIIPDSVTNIGSSTFDTCTGLTNATIGNGVTGIGTAAFYDCGNLRSVTLGNNVASIGAAAFEDCTSLAKVTFPKSVTNIAIQAFYDCRGLTNLTFLGNAPAAGANAFSVFGGTSSAVVYYLSGMSGWGSTYAGLPAMPISINGFSFTFNNGATTITGYTGGGNVTIPAVLYDYPVTAIAASAFANNNALTGIVIPNSVTNIALQAFQNDIYLTSVTLSTNLTSIGIQAFAGDVSLASLTIPASVRSLGVQAFYNDASLTNVTFLGDAPSLGNGTFGGDYATVYYYYGTHGWTNPFGGLMAVMLGAPNPPQIGGNAGVISGNFGFTLTGVASQTIIVEASTNLTSWSPVWTNALAGTTTNFTDPQWKNFPARFYRAR